MRAYLDLSRNILASNFKRLGFPYKLTFCVTYWCNYRCRTCNIWQRKPENELTLAEIGKFFRRSNKFNWIDFTGGEVWLRKDFVGIVTAAIENCPNLVMIHFPTNGYLTDRIVAGVSKILVLRPRKLTITVSTDGDEAVNDYVRGVSGGWRRQIETYKQLHAISGIDVFLGMTVSSLNAGEYDKAFAAAKAECPWLKSTDFHLNVVHESPHYYGNSGSGICASGRDPILEQVKRYRALRGFPTSPISLLEDRFLKHAEGYLRAGATPMRCHALHSSCFVDSWGDVYPCGMYDAKIATLRDYGFDLEAIWNLPKASALQKEIWDYKCPQCWTPCEAYQSILGNLIGQKRRTAQPREQSKRP